MLVLLISDPLMSSLYTSLCLKRFLMCIWIVLCSLLTGLWDYVSPWPGQNSWKLWRHGWMSAQACWAEAPGGVRPVFEMDVNTFLWENEMITKRLKMTKTRLKTTAKRNKITTETRKSHICIIVLCLIHSECLASLLVGWGAFHIHVCAQGPNISYV